jgi:hypothetical protein
LRQKKAQGWETRPSSFKSADLRGAEAGFPKVPQQPVEHSDFVSEAAEAGLIYDRFYFVINLKPNVDEGSKPRLTWSWRQFANSAYDLECPLRVIVKNGNIMGIAAPQRL